MNNEEDRSFLDNLVNCARDQILPIAASGNEVQAIGEFWEAVEQWTEGCQEDVQVNVSIGVYCKEGDPHDFLEHLHVDARVSESAVELSTLRRTYTKETGSDHHNEILAVLTRSRSPNDSGVAKWYELLEEVLGYESCRVSVSRDHL